MEFLIFRPFDFPVDREIMFKIPAIPGIPEKYIFLIISVYLEFKLYRKLLLAISKRNIVYFFRK